MRVFVFDLDGGGYGLDLALRAKAAGHATRFWLPTHSGGRILHGDGLVVKPDEWEPSVDWADLTVLTGNSSYVAKLESYFAQGYPIFGTNKRAAELELDREVGQMVLDQAGIPTLPYVVVNSAQDAIQHILREGKPYVLKPWGGAANKAMTFVSHTPESVIFTLERWEKEGLFSGQLMMQEMAEGVEVGIAGWFGPAGWLRWKEESFEHKKFMNDDLGENTGEQGTVIRHVLDSPLFKAVLEPLTEYLHSVSYTGDVSVNCIVNSEGIWPLEFTMRLGWPDFVIRQAVLDGDPVRWMKDLLEGNDTFTVREDIAVGVVMTHGDFPRGGYGDARPSDPSYTWAGYPIAAPPDGVGWQQVMAGEHIHIADGRLRRRPGYVTSGNYIAVVTGTGATVSEAMADVYGRAKELRWPSNVMYRTDIGARLQRDLPELQALGIAQGMRF